jgi:hypothetical protein
MCASGAGAQVPQLPIDVSKGDGTISGLPAAWPAALIDGDDLDRWRRVCAHELGVVGVVEFLEEGGRAIAGL